MKTQTIPHKTLFLSTKEKREARGAYVIRLGNWCGILLFGALAGFFLVMKVFGLHEILAFRFLNFVFILGGILTAFFTYKKKFGYKGIRYLTGIKLGFHVTLLGTVLFSLFMWAYLVIDTSFMNYIIEHGAFGEYLTPIRAAGGVFMESLATGAILTFSFMQLLKDEEFNPNLKK